MGEAKRRREAGLGFDPNQKLITGCYIAPAMISDRHTVYLGIRRKKAHIVSTKSLSVHTNVTDAWKFLTCCKEILRNCSFSMNQSDEKVFELFSEMLHNTYGNQSEEGDQFEVSGNIDAFNAWMLQGNYRDKNNPPPGVKITYLTPVVTKRYKVFCTPIKKESKNFYGNAEDNCIFHIGEKFDQPLLGNSKDLLAWKTYVNAAFVADYVNLHNKDSLTADEVQKLTHEAQNMFGQERSPGVAIELS